MSSSRSIEALTRSSPEPGSSLLEARRESRGVDSRVLVVNSREPKNLQSGVLPG